MPHARQTHWPDDVPRSRSISAYEMLIGKYDYADCGIDDRLEDGYEKVALFSDSSKIFTHICKQKDDGKWTSKLGEMIDVEHNSLRAFENSKYGLLHKIYKRTKLAKPSIPVNFPNVH